MRGRGHGLVKIAVRRSGGTSPSKKGISERRKRKQRGGERTARPLRAGNLEGGRDGEGPRKGKIAKKTCQQKERVALRVNGGRKLRPATIYITQLDGRYKGVSGEGYREIVGKAIEHAPRVAVLGESDLSRGCCIKKGGRFRGIQEKMGGKIVHEAMGKGDHLRAPLQERKYKKGLDKKGNSSEGEKCTGTHATKYGSRKRSLPAGAFRIA